MTLSSDALTILTSVKTDLGISGSTEDTYLERLIEVASARIKKYCNRTFYYSGAIAEYVPGIHSVFMCLARCPIESITSITYNGAAISADVYSIHSADAGILYNADRWYDTSPEILNISRDPDVGREEKLYYVTYKAGWVTPNQTGTRTLPHDLEQACIDLVVQKYRTKGMNPLIKNESLLSYSVGYNQGESEDMPAAIRCVLDGYKRVTIS